MLEYDYDHGFMNCLAVDDLPNKISS